MIGKLNVEFLLAYMVFITLMFLYPLWILLYGSIFAYLSIKILKNGPLGRLLSFLSVLSSSFVFIIYLFFESPLSLKYFHQLLIFELNPVNILCSLLTLVTSLLFFLINPAFANRKKGREDQRSFLIFTFMLFSSIGSILSSGIHTFVFFFELSFLLFFFLMRAKANGSGFSLFDYLIYFAPTAFSIVCATMLFFINPGTNEIGRFSLTMYVRVIFIVLFSARLLMLPLAFSVQRIADVFQRVESVYGLVISFIIICSGLIKFYHVDFEFAYSMAIISVIIMVLWSVYACRQKVFEDMLMFLYIVQTAFVVGALALMYIEERQGTFFYWMFLNHIVSVCGMLVCRILFADRQRGKYTYLFFMLFVISFIGFFPSPGLLGRWYFLQSHLFVNDYLSLLAKLMLIVGLSSAGCTFKWLPEIWQKMKTNNDSPASLSVRIFIGCSLIYLFAPLLFAAQINRFFLFLNTRM